MVAAVVVKSVRDRWLGIAIGAFFIGLFLLFGMSVYRQIDLSIYTDMPAGLRELFGIPADADVATLAYGAVYGFAGALTLASLAISIGAGSIAGEERRGTISVLLSNPVSRAEVITSKATSLVILTGVGTLLLWAAAVAVPTMLDVNIAGVHVGALMLHMFVNALFYGFLALAIGAWTGNQSAASGGAAGVMVVSYLAVGLLPLIESLADLARIFPWYYYSGSDPVTNGVHWGHAGVLAGGSALLGVAAVVGVNQRDLRLRSTGPTILDRLRFNPRTQAVVERLAGSTRVSRIWIKTASEHQGIAVIAGLIIAGIAIMVGPLYPLIDEDLRRLTEQLPDALLAMVGTADMATPEGWYQAELFSLMVPVAVITVTTVIAARGLAGEESRRTMSILLANPISRSQVVIEKAVAMVVHAIMLGAVTFASTMVGSVLGGLGLDPAHVAATSLLGTLIGTVFGGLALTFSAATGKVKFASFGTAGVALSMYLVNSFAAISDSAAGLARVSPFHYYLGSDPLATGLAWSDTLVLGGLTIAFVLGAIPLFERRDLRLGA